MYFYQPAGRMVERLIYRTVSYIRNRRKQDVSLPPSMEENIASNIQRTRTLHPIPPIIADKAHKYRDSVDNSGPEGFRGNGSAFDTILRLWGKLIPLSEFSDINTRDVFDDDVTNLLKFTTEKKNGIVLSHLLVGLVSQIWFAISLVYFKYNNIYIHLQRTRRQT